MGSEAAGAGQSTIDCVKGGWRSTGFPTQGYPAAEMKHGPIALVDAETPSVFLIPRGAVFDKVLSNLEEIKVRGGPVSAVACEGDEEVAGRADEVLGLRLAPQHRGKPVWLTGTIEFQMLATVFL